MVDTIDLLEVVGRNASLRNGSSSELERTLQVLAASHALRRATATGDLSGLYRELNAGTNQVAQNPPSPSPPPAADPF
ncbi:hypothetical protein [Oleiagrimonas soli]|uniref:Uncharacterized protein n=1 Tax=Oleiagrimonas soli TaxID=1543381 RepID=A0A841KJF6_9GAMM|nr:hypothetical protein [Oleiagrimonas soli]MBB6185336.1 hypothetical protein [Oleiagrimonas soli]